MATAKKAANKSASAKTATGPVAKSAPSKKATAKKVPASAARAKTAPASGSPAKTNPRGTAAQDAIKLLTADHREVKALFKQYQKLVDSKADDSQKQALAAQICMLLTVHATIEEELFYPAARGVLKDDEDLVDEADVEHASAKDLIAQIQSASPADDLYDAKVKVLGEYIDHHVQEEETEMFPKVKKGGMDIASMGAELAARKQALMAVMSGEMAAV